jgi:hypothetical protein
VHLDEADWQRHGHGADPRYGRVVLHVVLTRGEPAARHPQTGAPLPVFLVARHLSPEVLGLMDAPAALLSRYASLPGRCGLRAAQADPAAVEAIIAHAAEVRARAKADQLVPGWPEADEEQLLFELMFQSLGYRPFAPAFRQLARHIPLARLHDALQLPHAAARREVLSRWFGTLGLLDAPEPASLEPDALAERSVMAARWAELSRSSGPSSTPAQPVQGATGLGASTQTAIFAQLLNRGGSRPWNSPERRMVGLFHHLHGLGGGLLKGWLVFLKRLDALRDQPEFRQRAVAALNAAFATPADEPWRRRVSYTAPALRQEARLIGDDRIAVILANAIVPFFLAYARRQGDGELEKILYRLFIVLPGEGPNSKTRFMLQRLLPLKPLPRTLRTQQGLIQIHQDFCTSFESGCGECKFPDLIAPRTSSTI